MMSRAEFFRDNLIDSLYEITSNGSLDIDPHVQQLSQDPAQLVQLLLQFSKQLQQPKQVSKQPKH